MLLSTIQYKNDITGYFPLLQDKVNHGFSWGMHAKNMMITDNEPVEVTAAAKEFYALNNFSSRDVLMYGQHKDEIFCIEDTTDKALTHTTYGRRIDVDALFCTIPGYTLFTNPADCTVSIIYALVGNHPIIGLIHAGRRGADLELPTKAITYLRTKYGILPKDIFIGIAPSIAQKHYVMEHIDGFTNKAIWEGFYEKRDDGYHIDVLGLVLRQYHDAGIVDAHIAAYTVDTYEAAAKGESFSYFYTHDVENHILMSRFRVAVCL